MVIISKSNFKRVAFNLCFVVEITSHGFLNLANHDIHNAYDYHNIYTYKEVHRMHGLPQYVFNDLLIYLFFTTMVRAEEK